MTDTLTEDNLKDQDRFDAMKGTAICEQFKKELLRAKESEHPKAGLMVARAYNQLANNWARSHHTIKNLISSLRRVALGLNEALAMDALVLDHKHLVSIKRREAARMKERGNGMISFPNIADFERAVFDNRLATHSDSMLFVLYVTGRRPSEVRPENFVGGYDNSPARHCWFRGQAKTRGANKTEYDIPLVCTWADLRPVLARPVEWQGYPARDGVAGRLRSYVEWGLFPKEAPPTPKTLRALYAQRCYQMFASSNVAEWAYVREVLGHTVDDISTPLTYLRFKLGAYASAWGDWEGVVDSGTLESASVDFRLPEDEEVDG